MYFFKNQLHCERVSLWAVVFWGKLRRSWCRVTVRERWVVGSCQWHQSDSLTNLGLLLINIEWLQMGTETPFLMWAEKVNTREKHFWQSTTRTIAQFLVNNEETKFLIFSMNYQLKIIRINLERPISGTLISTAELGL